MTIPGTPARMNVIRHPIVWLPQPPSAAPSEVPIGTPRAKIEKAVPRRLFEK